MNIVKNPFLTWLFITGLTATGFFWAVYYGLIGMIVISDFTQITWAIMAIFALANVYLGWIAYRLQSDLDDMGFVEAVSVQKSLYQEFDIFWFLSAKLPQLGFIGTVIGLAHLLQTSTMGITAADSSLVATLMHSIGSTSGTALYPTLMGLIASLLIQLHLFILTYIFKRRGYVSE